VGGEEAEPQEARCDGVGEPSAEGEDIAVCEVDELEDAEDERVAEGDECVEGADGDAVGQGLDEGLGKMRLSVKIRMTKFEIRINDECSNDE
jgi:hypothetical protein